MNTNKENLKDNKEFEKFEVLTRKLVSVPKTDIQERQKVEKKEREAKKERISDIILPINNKFLFTSFTTSLACEKEKHKKSTLNFFSFAMAFFVSFSYSPSCGTLQRYYLSSFVTTSNFSSRRISRDVFSFFVW